VITDPDVITTPVTYIYIDHDELYQMNRRCNLANSPRW